MELPDCATLKPARNLQVTLSGAVAARSAA
jgi:hypothetical protein